MPPRSRQCRAPPSQYDHYAWRSGKIPSSEAHVGNMASGRRGSGSDDMPVRKRAAKPPEPSAGAREIDLTPVEDEVVRPAHQVTWLGGVLVEQGSITQEQLDDA